MRKAKRPRRINLRRINELAKGKKIGCYDCGLEYGKSGWVETIVPDYIWKQIRPEGAEGTGGLLCITCICKRLTKLNLVERIPVFICGTEPIQVISNSLDYPMQEFIIRNWKPKPKTKRGK